MAAMISSAGLIASLVSVPLCTVALIPRYMIAPTLLGYLLAAALLAGQAPLVQGRNPAPTDLRPNGAKAPT
jgi:hypothetical protein